MFARTLTKLDKRLQESELVLAVEVNGKYKAYVLSGLKKNKVKLLEDDVAGEPVVIFYDEEANTASCYLRTLSGQKLKFVLGESFPVKIMDSKTRSQWDITGKATFGDMKGKQLQYVPSRVVEWYAQGAYFPDTEIYEYKESKKSE